ncbi:MAG: YeiH family protein [Myxococcota bacterium]
MSAPASRRNVYEQPELWDWAGSMEGVPDALGPGESFDERANRKRWQTRGNDWFGLCGALLPGLGVALGLAWLGELGSAAIGERLLGLAKSPLSPILCAIALGLAIRNAIGLPTVYEPGLRFALRRLLRLGVVLLGIRMSLATVGELGLRALPIVGLCIAAALAAMHLVSRALALPPRLGTLIAVGTAICGNTAIVATAPVIGADDDELGYAVATITGFGMLALLVHPFLAHALFAGDAQRVGLFLGTAIHDTAQVAGAGLLYAQHFGAPAALDAATVTKLVRNACMVAVIPLLALAQARGAARGSQGKRPRFSELVPHFVFGFLALALLRTLGDLGGERPFGGLVSAARWEHAIESLSVLSGWCLTVAMAAVGLGTNLKQLRKLGGKPLAAGFVAALTVGLVSFLAIRALDSSAG